MRFGLFRGRTGTVESDAVSLWVVTVDNWDEDGEGWVTTGGKGTLEGEVDAPIGGEQ